MLETLHITNYALIDEATMEFAPGFNAVTGETGAGKSIMLGALALVQGGRADAKAVTGNGAKSVVEAVFAPASGVTARLQPLFETHDLDPLPDGRVIMRRELTPGGRSRAFVNDRPVSLGVMRDVARELIDIHSQQENQLLADPAFQLSVIDRLASNEAEREAYATTWHTLLRTLKRYKAANAAASQRHADETRMRDDLALLDDLNPLPGEQEALEREYEFIETIEERRSQLEGALSLLCDESGDECDTLVDRLHRASVHSAKAFDGAAGSDQGADLSSRLESLAIEARDIADTLERLQATMLPDQRRREELHDRLGRIYALQRRFGLPTTEALHQLQQQLRSEIDAIDNGDTRLAEAREEARAARAAAVEAAQALTASRRRAATKLAATLRETAAPLGMANLNVDIRLEPSELGAQGADKAAWLFAFNKNSEPRPVAGAASGGEVSRLMLSVKSIVAGSVSLPSMIFDEVDTGVSGKVASCMGAMMAGMASASGMQVIAITHLPQVAAAATAHFKVYKADTESATHTHITRLSQEGRVDELSTMLAGNASIEEARATARILLQHGADPQSTTTR